MKELVPQDATKRIKHIQFGVLSAQEIVGMSELECTTRDMYALRQDGGERYPVSHGVLDRRLVSSRGKQRWAFPYLNRIN